MVGIDYLKVAKLSEEKGNLKKAADYYAAAGEIKKADEIYNQILSTTKDKSLIRDIEKRLTQLNHSHHLTRTVPGVNKILEWRVAFLYISVVSLISALFLISINLTGNSIGNLNENNMPFVGTVLFVLGLGAFLFSKIKTK